MWKQFFLACLLVSSTFGAGAPLPAAVHVNNLGIVNDHLWRGAEPTPTALTELRSAGVKVVIDLRETSASTELEKQGADKLGIQYKNIPLPPLSAPSPDQVQAVLKMLTENPSQTIFVHCRRGKDRTGTVIACYRIAHDGWDNHRAFEEAKEFGMSAAERGMRSFILHFTPALQPGILAAKP